MNATTPGPIVIALLLGIVIGLPGLLMLVMGVRGKRIDTHPRCRGCGYDLSGHDGTPSTCPECGRELAKAKRAVRIGNRKRRPIMATLGALMLLVSLCSVGTFVWARSSQVNLIEHYPVWLLRMDLESDDAGTADAAIAELLRRQSLGELDRNDVRLTVDRLMVRHADATAYWTSPFCEFVETEWMNGNIDDERMARYIKTALEQSLVIDSRPRVRSGNGIPLRVAYDLDRLSIDFGRYGYNNPETDVFALRRGFGEIREGERVLRDLSGLYSFGPVSPGSSVSTTTALVALEPGVHELKVTSTFELCLVAYEDIGNERAHSSGEVLAWEVETMLPIQVLGENEHIIALIPDDDPELALKVRDAVLIDLINAKVEIDSQLSSSYEAGRGYVDVIQPPVDVAFAIFGRSNGEETKLGSIARQAGAKFTGGWLTERVADIYPDANAIDIILRPDRSVAERTLDINEIWGSELVFENVPLRPADVDQDDNPPAEQTHL